MKLKELAIRFLGNKYLAFGITLVIFVLCTMPSEQLPKGNDKTAHFVTFAGWAFCWQFAFKNYARTLIVGILYGILIEFWQGSLPASFHRSFDWYDALADAIGVIIGLFVFCLSTVFKRR
ncbi:MULTISPECIES: VanZ family protein [Emticicia]|uniref:VanZ family protein n=1 Tax=Emticicia TaxID=312278 RepID=UPI0007D8BB37|nr:MULTISPECIES: VanZ family protein [Emticicia]